MVEIDYPNRRVSFYSMPSKKGSKRAKTDERSTSLHFRYASDSILLDDVTVNGKKVTTLFDTGLNGSFAVMPASIPTLQLKSAFDSAKPANSTGFAGASTARLGSVSSVKIGNIDVLSPTVVWKRAPATTPRTTGLLSVMGF